MPAHQRRAVWLLGLCQCVLWGVLYYSFPVLLVPIEGSLALPRPVVAGAFSAALLAMALMAPAVGRRLDAGQAVRVFRTGTGLALGGLVLVALAGHGAMLYLGWGMVGVAMAALLYEPAFALVGRAVEDPKHRLRALAAVTVFGGLASSVFLPLLSSIVEAWSWRAAVIACMAAVVCAAWILEAHVVPALPAVTTAPSRSSQTRQAPSSRPPYLPVLMAIFALGTFAGMALTTLLIPLLVTRGASPAVAAAVLAMLGVAQLPGRLWLLRVGDAPSRATLHLVPLVLQGAALLAIVVAARPWQVALAVAVFGIGAGLQTLLRPWLVQRLCGDADAGRWNGEVARVQGFARAAAPVAAAGAAWIGGASAVIGGLGALLLMSVPLARRLPA